MCRPAIGMKLFPALVALALCGCDPKIEMPEDLTGAYVATDALYANRHIDLTASQITLGLGGGRSERYPITAVYRDFENGRTLYKVVYRTSYGKDNLQFYHEVPGGNGQIVLKNRPGVRWTRGEWR